MVSIIGMLNLFSNDFCTSGDKADEADLPNLIFNLVFEFNVFSEFNKCEIIVGTTENQVT